MESVWECGSGVCVWLSEWSVCGSVCGVVE